MFDKFKGTPLEDDIWFASHQDLLLRVINTQYGRDLLCIPQDFPTIVEIGKGHIKGLLEEDKAVFRLHTGAKFGNVIRHRWKAFGEYARRFYDKQEEGLTNIHLHGQRRLAATTHTFYPRPGTGTAPIDGDALRAISSFNWDDLHDGAGTAHQDTVTFAQASFLKITTTNFRIYRAILGFPTSSLSGLNIVSAKIKVFVTSKKDNHNDAYAYVNVVEATPASNSDIVNADYTQVGAIDNPTKFANDMDITTATLSDYNEFILNSDGINYINKEGDTMFGMREGHDIEDIAITPGGNNTGSQLVIRTADEIDITEDPVLEVITRVAQRFPLSMGGMGALGRMGVR